MTNPIILVGVTASQVDSVATTAINFAVRMGCSVLFVTVDVSSRLVKTEPDGMIMAESIDSDVGGVVVEQFDAQLELHLRELAVKNDVPCHFLASAGDLAVVLTDAANDMNALMIVVGTRKTSLAAALREFFIGSVASSLVHRQHRPVLVVPVERVAGDRTLPRQVMES